jgi:serine/threonine protein kinase
MEFKRCYGCMRELDAPGTVCPHCGYDNTNDPKKQPSHVLSCGTILNGQYMVGRSLGQGGFGITYIGYDLNLEIPVCIKEYYPEGYASRSATQSHMVYWGTSENAQEKKEN